MTEIKVILDEDPSSDLSTLTPEERELLFDQLANDNPDIPKVIFDSFAEMQTINIARDAKLNKPDLKELLLRKTIHLGQNHGSNFNTSVIPIIPGFANVNIRRPVRESKSGGAFPPMRRMKPESKSKTSIDTPDAIKVRFDQQIFAVTSDGLDYIVPPNEELDVIGLIINPICSKQQVLGSRGLKPISAIRLIAPKIRDRITLGNYSYTDASKACDGYFTKPNYAITIGGEVFKDPTKIMFAEIGEKRVISVLGTVFDYLASFEAHHTDLHTAQFIHTQLDVAIDGSATMSVEAPLRKLIEYIKAPREIPSVHTKDAVNSDIVSILETLHYGRFSPVYLTGLLADIDMRGFSRTYYKSMIKGKDDVAVKEQLDLYKDRQSRIAFRNSVRAKLLDEQNNLNTYKMIIEKKLGAKRLMEVEQELSRRPSLSVAAKNILEILKPNERKPIELEFERRAKYLTAVINNKCPHVKLYRQYRLAKTDDKTRQYYMDLKKFFKNGNNDTSMIQCNSCGFDIMCPHMRDYTEMDLAGKFHTEIKGKLTRYIDKSVTKDSYYCKICGETISSLEAFGDVGQTRDPTSMMNEELKNFMWGEMAVLTKYLKFGHLINVPGLITAMRDAAYLYIFEIEKQILKSKTNSVDEIKAKKRLFITIYAFAYMIHLILSNKGRGETEISFKNYAPKGSKNVIVDMIRHSLEIIIMSRNIIIREIPGMTGDLIKNKLIEAYKSMQSNGSQVITHSGEAEGLLTTLMLDPVYKYIYNMNITDDMLAGKKPSKNKFDIVDKVDIIMGDTIAKLEKSDNIFKNVKIPKFDTKWNLKAFDDIKPMNMGKTYTGPKSIFANAYSGYRARSFEVFNEKLKSKLYTEPMYVDVSAGGKDDIMDVKFRPQFEKHREHYLELERKETELLKYRAMESAKNWTWLSTAKTRRWTNPDASLGRLFDEDGNTHIWNIFIINKIVEGKVSRVEVKTADIAKNTESGTKFSDVIIDKKCSGCGMLRSQTSTLDEAKIRDSLQARHVINNFFRFYENRCPKGSLHDFGVGIKCSKCNIDNTYILNTTTKEAMNYYREYKPVYSRERAEFSMSDDSTVRVAAKPLSDVSSFAEEFANWSFNFNMILDLANKLKVNHRLLSALGAVEKQEYSEVQSGAYIPPEAEHRNDTRIYVVNTHVKNLITEYNQLRFFHKLVKPPIDLSIIIDNSGVNKHRIAELGSKLPDIFNNYNNRFTYVHRFKKPREIVSFCIETFCEMCLRIYTDGEKETEKLRHDFVDYFVKKTLRSEELLSKPGHFNWSLLYGDKEVKEKESYDSNTAREVEGDPEPDEVDEDEDFGDTGKPFDNGFDVEDGDDPDDTDNDWKVGDDRGL